MTINLESAHKLRTTIILLNDLRIPYGTCLHIDLTNIQMTLPDMNLRC